MIHQYKLNGYNIVLDSNSGCVHVVDDLAYDVIAMSEKHSREQIISAMLIKYAQDPSVDLQEIKECLDDVAELMAEEEKRSKKSRAKSAFSNATSAEALFKTTGLSGITGVGRAGSVKPTNKR